MAERVIWSPTAADNFEKAVEYIAENSKYYAVLFARKILELTQKLELFPKIGRVVPEYADNNLRELFHGNYRIVYRIKKDLVEIVTLAHSAQLLKNVNFN
ncbi:toxin doc [Candidatus Termititenax aidoneus]|uniref:Toxin doc n=1 Tax=Termititenax aidoneus TaxID=2218524 RepID=A0A388TB62_TERA1|nr:toxin doc [Candidatus Termititenax aidoneus]